MSGYNTKNYMEQGGDKWVIGGELEFDKMSGGVLPNIATPASDANAAAVRTALIALITSMKDHGLMTGDAMTVTYGAVTSDPETDRAANTAKISGVTVNDNIITITLSSKVSDLNDFDGGNGWGVHKWLGIGLNVSGVSDITDLEYNDSPLTSDDVAEATTVGLSSGYFVRWVAADLVLAGDNTQKSKDNFTLWSSGLKKTGFTLKIVEPAT